jgi:hypothetical protein
VNLIDSLVATGLALALLLVIALDKLVFSSDPGTGSTGVKVEEPVIQVSKSAAPRPPRIAVTQTYEEKVRSQSGQQELEKWDDMPKLLDSLGEGYKYTIIPVSGLVDAKKLGEYDVLFYTCGRGGADSDITSRLHDFVVNGGTLYASDWRYTAVALAFPDYQSERLQGSGAAGTIEADVVDPGLRDALGSPTVKLKFNLSQWKTAAFGNDLLPPEDKDKVKVLIAGTYRQVKGDTATAPLLVKFQAGKGVVIFTSFHNEKQTSEVEKKLLNFLVFSAVTAKTEAEVAQTMLKGGFSPQKSNLLSASPESPSVTKTYHNKNAGPLRFSLGFENRGARLKLTVVPPKGEKREHVGTSTFSMDFRDALIGDWQYTVTAEVIPFPNFPFTLTVGESVDKK